MNVDLTFPVQELEYFLLVFARVATFVYAAPFFSQKGVPNQTKIGLSVFVAYLMYTVIQPHTYPEYNTVFGYSVIIAKEVAVGLFLGAGAQLCTSIVLFAGRIIDMEIGISMASVLDPTTNEQSSVSGVLLQYGVLLILFTTGLHRYLLKALAETFTLIPIGGAVFNMDSLLNSVIEFLGDYIVLGFRICLPVFASIMLMNIVLGLLAKLAPQMNMFSVGIQLKLIAGLTVVWIMMGLLPDVCNMISTKIQQMVVAMVEGMME